VQVATSGLASIARLPFGVNCNVVRAAGQPAQPLQLYEYELSPFCRRVREVRKQREREHTRATLLLAAPAHRSATHPVHRSVKATKSLFDVRTGLLGSFVWY
jgi:hypothetical protein